MFAISGAAERKKRLVGWWLEFIFLVIYFFVSLFCCTYVCVCVSLLGELLTSMMYVSVHVCSIYIDVFEVFCL